MSGPDFLPSQPRPEWGEMSSLVAIQALLALNTNFVEVGTRTKESMPWAQTVRLFLAPTEPIDLRDTATMNRHMSEVLPSLVLTMHDAAFFNPNTQELQLATNYYDELMPGSVADEDDNKPKRRIWIVLYPDRVTADYAFLTQQQLDKEFIAKGRRHPLAYESPLLYSVDATTWDKLHPRQFNDDVSAINQGFSLGRILRQAFHW